MAVFFVRELARNLPAVSEIELDGNRIRPNNAQAARPVAAGSYFGFTLRKQSTSNTSSSVLAIYP